ncbi:kit ligand isoform X2 [Alligator mississippiensis]|uniref:kit ligand isoform X2 n=1 Tax=Alligator mississippiensis TaxID=8496 RepID=UPI0028774A39|nr:kit ligand isoform X2 [Alligator mississippiensis]
MKRTQTWIITCFYLQLLLLSPLVRAHSPCGNPVTDDVNDITILVGNLPNDYRITLKYVEKMESLPNHCWLYLMVPEFSKSLNNLLHKFSQISDVLSNHSIINNLTRIIYDLMECLALDKNKNFKQESDHLYKEGKFIPEEFFRHFNNIIEAYKTFSETSDYDDCVLPSTETPVHDSKVTETKPFSLPPVAASSLKNNNDSSVLAVLPIVQLYIKGGQRKCFKDVLKVNLKKNNININSWDTISQDFPKWRKSLLQGSQYFETLPQEQETEKWEQQK